jgi:hypothetical protein
MNQLCTQGLIQATPTNQLCTQGLIQATPTNQCITETYDNHETAH